MSGRTESMAAVVNGVLVLLLPIALVAAGSSIDLNRTDSSVTAEVRGSPRLEAMIPMLISTTLVSLPFALLAGWRTNASAFAFISDNRQIASVRAFIESLPDTLRQ